MFAVSNPLSSGRLFKDTVTIAPGVSASEQPIGVALSTFGMFPGDGILG